MKGKLKCILKSKAYSFNNIHSEIPDNLGGVYLMTLKSGKKEYPLYIGRAGRLHQRIYTNHLMGSGSSSQLKKYLLKDEQLKALLKGDWRKAKEYIKSECYIRWITDNEISKNCPLQEEQIYKLRSALEGYFTGMLFPKYGIYKEH